MRAAPLPRGARQHGGDRVHQPGVVSAGHQRHAGQAAGSQAAQERHPACAVLGAGHVDAQDLAVPLSIDAGRDQAVHVHRPAALADLLVSASIHTKVYGLASSGRFRKLAASSSRSAAMALTCDLDRPTTPREAASFSTRRVETPSR